MSPDWESRYFSFDSAWDVNEQMASMRNGSGDDWSVTFTAAGAYLRGFDHESPLSPWARTPPSPWPGLLEPLPAELAGLAHDEAWQLDGVTTVTVSLWRLAGESQWNVARPHGSAADLDDGSDWLFERVDGQASTYAAFAEEYYELDQPLDREAIEHIYAGRPITAELARRLNPQVEWDELQAELLQQIGYPTA